MEYFHFKCHLRVSKYLLTSSVHLGKSPADCLQALTQWTIVSIHRQTISDPLCRRLCPIAINRESHQSKEEKKKQINDRTIQLFSKNLIMI